MCLFVFSSSSAFLSLFYCFIFHVVSSCFLLSRGLDIDTCEMGCLALPKLVVLPVIIIIGAPLEICYWPLSLSLVVGCPDMTPPPNTWYKRSGDNLTVGCRDNHKAWNLSCNNNQWTGVTGNCTEIGNTKQRTAPYFAFFARNSFSSYVQFLQLAKCLCTVSYGAQFIYVRCDVTLLISIFIFVHSAPSKIRHWDSNSFAIMIFDTTCIHCVIQYLHVYIGLQLLYS